MIHSALLGLALVGVSPLPPPVTAPPNGYAEFESRYGCGGYTAFGYIHVPGTDPVAGAQHYTVEVTFLSGGEVVATASEEHAAYPMMRNFFAVFPPGDSPGVQGTPFDDCTVHLTDHGPLEWVPPQRDTALAALGCADELPSAASWEQCDLLENMLTLEGNDAATALAEHVEVVRRDWETTNVTADSDDDPEYVSASDEMHRTVELLNAYAAMTQPGGWASSPR